MTNPYRDLPDNRYWRRSVARTEAHCFNPVLEPRFTINRHSRVATAGSCFAQHIARALADAGCNFFQTETGEHLDSGERARLGYGIFSARFGNIYTTMQLNQLFDEAFGKRIPDDRAWQRPDLRWIDPFRQQIEPDGFIDAEAVVESRAEHLEAVRAMFELCDVFVFTLGLTECWRALSDGSVYSAAPGVIADSFDSTKHIFTNLDVVQSYAELRDFLGKFRDVNPRAQVMLTVSPVPLIATADKRSITVATAYSKAVLRVVAELAWKEHDWVDYFPSYEIITGSQARGRYFEDDAREVNGLGVAHAMRCFLSSYLEGGNALNEGGRALPAVADRPQVTQYLCDEEVLDSREVM